MFSLLKDVQLRGYTRDDLRSMFELDVLCFDEPFRFSQKDMRRFAEARRAQVVLATSNEQLAGFSIVHRERSGGVAVGYLLTLDIAPDFRLRGLAQLLIGRAERDAREAGCGAMLLHVFTENSGAIALYEKLGYGRFHLAENFYGRGLHGWVFQKALGPDASRAA